jgi:hypothetical protein
VAKIVTLEQQRLALLPRQSVREAITKIETCTMPALSKIAIRIASNARLVQRYGLDGDLGIAQ